MATTTTDTTAGSPTTARESAPAAAPAAATPAARPADTGARDEQAARAITADRERIDALDLRIIALIEDRMAISGAIQHARIASGGRRVNLARETEIISAYHTRLGRPGTALAMTLLELCRGRA